MTRRGDRGGWKNSKNKMRKKGDRVRGDEKIKKKDVETREGVRGQGNPTVNSR
jgi:hypothetical protein